MPIPRALSRPARRPAVRGRLGSVVLLGLALALSLAFDARPGAAADLRFQAAPDGGFSFNTGFLRGRLRLGGKSLGLQEVTYVASRQRLDRSNGLLSHYRVFANGQRFGGGAWDWTSTARLRDDGAVEVTWPAEGRPFTVGAVYRWIDPATVELETTVQATAELRGFESFVASYFQERFTNAWVAVPPAAGATGPAFARAERTEGEWQAFPRDPTAAALIRDGRWKIEPNPVEWTVRTPFAFPLARRRAPVSGLSAVLMAPAEECFAVSLPHETEAHNSVYFSLVGRDVKAGETVRGRIRLSLAVARTDAAVLALYEAAVKEWAGSPAR